MEVRPSKGIPQYNVAQSRTEILPKLPARLVVASPSGGGKTVLITQLLLSPNFYRGAFEKIYYFSASATVDANLIPLKKYCEDHLDQGEEDPMSIRFLGHRSIDRYHSETESGHLILKEEREEADVYMHRL